MPSFWQAGGEGGTTVSPATFMNAVIDALKDYGVRNIKMPATPFNVWQAIQNAQR